MTRARLMVLVSGRAAAVFSKFGSTSGVLSAARFLFLSLSPLPCVGVRDEDRGAEEEGAEGDLGADIFDGCL